MIREGATLIQSAADVIEAIGPMGQGVGRLAPTTAPVLREPAPVPVEADDDARRVVTGLLGTVGVAVDEIIRQSGVPAAIVQTILLELELAGRLERHAGGKVSRTG